MVLVNLERIAAMPSLVRKPSLGLSDQTIMWMHHEQSAPRFCIVVFQAGGIFTTQRVDDGPYISFVGLQLGHGCIQVNCRSGAEQAMCAVTLHTRTGGNVGHVPAL